MLKWFGESWGALVNQDCERIAVPFNAICLRCFRRFESTDQGVLLDGVPDSFFHLDCFLKSTISHARWGQLNLVPDAGDGFEMREDGRLHCDHCGWSYDPSTGGWFVPGS